MSDAPLRWIQQAKTGGYALGAFNVHSDETTQALLLAAETAQSPVFLQIGRAVIPHMGVLKAHAMTMRHASESSAQYAIHLDHGSFDEVLLAIRLGFDSIMYDGAHLPLDENIASTKRVVELAHAYGIPVEAELGRIPDAGEEVDWSSYYTDVDEAERFVAETGVDLLAISAGVVHGITPAEPQPLAVDLVERIRAVVPIPLVLHGASGVPDDQIQAAIKAGVHKLNADTDLRHAFRAGLEAAFAEGDRQLEYALTCGRDRMVQATVEKMRVYGCAGSLGSHAAQSVGSVRTAVSA